MTHHNPPNLLWLFDLDNTLHNASHAIFPGITQRMNQYLARVLGAADAPAPAEVVNAARTLYWKRYGATLLGMIKHHQVSADDFLRETHDLGDLAALLRYERGLAQLLRRLPGPKILLTNAPARYSREVLRHLRLHREFERHIAIENMRVRGELRPKPSKAMLRRVLARHGRNARRCVLVEDTLANLRAAHRLGMRTVWVTQYLSMTDPIGAAALPRMRKRPAFVDVKVKSVRQIPRQLRRLR
ncbi:MAG TPA: HAD-IA family hydrolase [Telluria sp.]|nr:HAD-IA family hydrolase [Telluria sp.]